MAKSSIGKKVLKLGFVGAGGINFGTPEGPWNHAAKLEKFPGIPVTLYLNRDRPVTPYLGADLIHKCHLGAAMQSVAVSHTKICTAYNNPL